MWPPDRQTAGREGPRDTTVGLCDRRSMESLAGTTWSAKNLFDPFPETQCLFIKCSHR